MHGVEEDNFFFSKFHDPAILKQSIKNLYIHPVAGGNITLIVMKNHEAISLTHRAQDAGTLTTG
jgi:hypothetical protein